MNWQTPAYCEIRLGFEVTAYVYVRFPGEPPWKSILKCVRGLARIMFSAGKPARTPTYCSTP